MPTLQQTYSTQPHQKVLSSLERTNTHLLSKILDTLIPSNGGYLVIWYPLFDKEQYLYPIITRIPSAPPYSLCLSRWYPMLPDKSKSFFPNHVPSLHLSQKEEYVCLWQHWPMNVKGWTSPNFFPISFSLLFTKQIEFLYCNLSSFLIWIIIGRR